MRFPSPGHAARAHQFLKDATSMTIAASNSPIECSVESNADSPTKGLVNTRHGPSLYFVIDASILHQVLEVAIEAEEENGLQLSNEDKYCFKNAQIPQRGERATSPSTTVRLLMNKWLINLLGLPCNSTVQVMSASGACIAWIPDRTTHNKILSSKLTLRLPNHCSISIYPKAKHPPPVKPNVCEICLCKTSKDHVCALPPSCRLCGCNHKHTSPCPPQQSCNHP